MNAPSNANTSGLEVVAFLMTNRRGHTSASTMPPADGGDVVAYEPLVTAASAQAEIGRLTNALAKANAGFEEHERKWYLEQDRATAAEARLDRAEARIAEIATMFGVCDGGRYLNDWKARLAALQQETKP